MDEEGHQCHVCVGDHFLPPAPSCFSLLLGCMRQQALSFATLFSLDALPCHGSESYGAQLGMD